MVAGAALVMRQARRCLGLAVWSMHRSHSFASWAAACPPCISCMSGWKHQLHGRPGNWRADVIAAAVAAVSRGKRQTAVAAAAVAVNSGKRQMAGSVLHWLFSAWRDWVVLTEWLGRGPGLETLGCEQQLGSRHVTDGADSPRSQGDSRATGCEIFRVLHYHMQNGQAVYTWSVC
jgi:hypothetical protein